MRRFLLSLSSAVLLLSPAVAFAAFSTPSQLFQSLQDDMRARSFSATAHAGSQGTYVSVWANGKNQDTQAGNTSLSMNVTVDTVQGTTKTRIKGQVLVIDEILYFKILSVQSTPKNAATDVLQKQWISIPLVQSSFGSVSDSFATGFTSSSLAAVDSIFTLSSYTTDKGFRVYKLSLTPDSAVDLAMQLRSLLNDTQSISSDFFPWRELGKSISFSMTVVLTSKDRFVSSTFSLSMKTKSSSFSAMGSEQLLSGALSLTAPTDAVALSSLPQSASGLMQELPLELQEPSLPQESPESGTELSVPSPVPSDACTDPTVSPVKFLELQRSGVCPTKKVPTRYGGW